MKIISARSQSPRLSIFSQMEGITNRITRIREEMGASENKENLPSCWAVITARGNPTTTSSTPADNPTTRIHSFGFMMMPTVAIPHPNIATQCKRWTNVKKGMPMVMILLRLAIPFMRQNTQAIPNSRPNKE